MKILHVEAGKHLYGGGLQVVYLIEALSAIGITNVLVAPINSEILTACAELCELSPIAMNGDLDLFSIGRLRAVIRQHSPDLIHIHSRRGADVFGLIASKLERVPVVLTRRVDNSEPAWFSRAKYSAYNQVVVISEGIRQVLVSQGVDDRELLTVASAVDTARYRPAHGKAYELQRENLIKSFNLEGGAVVIAVIAQLIKRKGHETLLQALPQILGQHPHCHLILFGQGPHERALKRSVARLDMDHHVTFAGFRDEMETLIPYLDLVVHPAYKEGLGVALLQAGACSVPIVAARAGGIPEIIEHKKNGLLVEPGDSRGLAQAVSQLLGDQTLRREMGKAGRQIIQSRFSIEAMVKAYLKIYKSIVD